MGELATYTGGRLVIGGTTSVFPLLVITCSQCGYVVLINAIVAGIFQAEGPGPEPEAQAVPSGEG